MEIRQRHKQHEDSPWVVEETEPSENTPLLSNKSSYSNNNNNNNNDNNGSMQKRQTDNIGNSSASNNNSSVVDFFSQILTFIYETWSSIWQTTPSIYEPSEEEKRKMNELRTLAQLPYDSQNDHHEKLLMQLWESFSTTPLEARKTKQWGALGFQGTDPATDFRGVGVFGLRNILYLSEKYPKLFQRLTTNKTRAKKDFGDYPFAITGFALTALIFEMSGWGIKPKNLPFAAKKNLCEILFNQKVNFESKPSPFEELYCLAFHEFDRHWFENDAHIMDFQKIQELTCTMMIAYLGETNSLDQLIQRNQLNAN